MVRPLVQGGEPRTVGYDQPALSTANSCLYGICHAAVVAAGYSPALGFIHTGKMLSFVFDVADLYKTEVSIPAAFMAAADGTAGLDAKVRRYSRNLFQESRLLARIVADIDEVLATGPLQLELDFTTDTVEGPSDLWDPVVGSVRGGASYASGQVAQLMDDLNRQVGDRVQEKRRPRARRPGRSSSG